MNEEKIIYSLGYIDESLIYEVERLRKRKSFPYKTVGIIAACLLFTVILIPWGVAHLGKDPSSKDPYETDGVTDILQNDDTSYPDTTDTPQTNEDPPVLIPESTYDNTENSPQDTDSSVNENTENSFDPPETLPPIPQENDTEKIPEDTSSKETTGPLVPETPSTPDHGTPIPQYPTILSHTVYPVQEMYPSSVSLLDLWRSNKNERINYYKQKIGNTDSFMFRTLCEFFSNAEDDNIVYSPVNIYMTLGMLTETTAQNSREQLLGLLGENDIYALRASAKNLWNCCYRDDGIVTSVLGSSMWLDNSFVPNTAVTDVLSDYYYASSFYGNMGNESYNELMRSWLNEQTRGLLKDTVANKSFNPDSTMTLMPTVYFKANWENGFNAENTRTEIFHSDSGDMAAQFMEKEHYEMLYVGDTFTATRMTFKEGDQMWFILPNDNIKPLELFLDYEAMGFITGKTQQKLPSSAKEEKIALSIPKFDISSEMDLIKGLKGLGITDIFDPEKADFSNLTDSMISVGGINHLLRVRMDENGFEAAAVGETVLPSLPPPGSDSTDPIEFTLDRPFIFVITSDSGLPLFVGMVNQPN